MRFRITYANAMATLALFIVIGGTAQAAVRLTSTNVTNSSITSSDIKAGSLTSTDLSTAAKAAFVGAQGDKGRTGSTGSVGITGAAGKQGDRGSAAFMTSSFAYRDTGLATQRLDTILPNNNGAGSGKDWDDPTYSSFDGPFPQLRTTGNYQSVPLSSTGATMVQLYGMDAASAGATQSAGMPLKVTFAEANLLANGSITLMHRMQGESPATNSGGTQLLHGRAGCWIVYANSTTGIFQTAGVPALVSSGANGRNHELVNVSVTGTATGLTAGAEYNVFIQCQDLDYTGSTQWELVSANLTALASQ